MGRHRFRLADMLPHSCFHKLKVKTTPTTPTPTNPTPCPPPPPPTLQHQINYGRPSYYIPSNPDHSPLHPKASDTKFLVDPPRKSKKKRKKIHGSRPPLKPLSPSFKNLEWDPSATTPNLPPILTKPKKDEHAEKEQEPRSPRKRFGTHGGAHHGIKMRSNSPRLVGRMRRVGNCTRKGIGRSVLIVKSSADPQKDFRESMLEMIVENNIRAGEEMEELLACYLALNSKEYHDVIEKVFVQIWLDLTTLRLS